jgi:uncharacterized protein with FMN-binding domain
MRRAPIVVAATAAGLAAVLMFHNRPAPITIGTLPAASSRSTVGKTPTTTGPPAGSSSTTTTTTPSTTTSGTRTATGPQENYGYGVLSVSVTVSGKRITGVTLASLEDGGNGRSQSIDEQAIPILEQEALTAQSADIQGVSGASYTSAGFVQSLQGALRTLDL